jgi:uncharacterized Zn finger protein
MSASPAIRAKALRLLEAGRVVVTCDDDGIGATVEGDHDRYRLTLTSSGWRCPCPARGVCAHLIAVERTTGWRR